MATVAPPAPRTRSASQPRAPRLAIRSATRTDSVTPALQQAWQDYQRGNYASASEGYRNVLAQDIRNRDALLGMGAIAQQTGNEQEAQQFFHQVLLLDPRDPVALAAMTSYATPNSEDAEIRLRQMLANQPRSAALHYALGNVYLDQSRWAEAQQAYFTALALEPGSPQYSYNLAVSLDHLGQGKLAADYYRQTLQLDPSGRSGFDAAQAQRRLNELNAAR
ncbi:tetratricopeptide repeat protein [Ferrigenium sp. UT5]|uniref:tetratricopeptide repeat protein n=1 Tax=Ferrigenium sp. UT5 TaxID=3242105 RepID=UPI00354D1FDE